jgi:flavin reductase (DIM6/NTAB) family NADH-FMN oxidoreductase RutF
VNAAPHSWVSNVDYDPPQILFSVNVKHDTYRNVLESGEFVANIAGADMIRENLGDSETFSVWSK